MKSDETKLLDMDKAPKELRVALYELGYSGVSFGTMLDLFDELDS